MKNIYIIYLLVIIFILIIYYKVSSFEPYQNTLLFRKYINIAKCLEGDIDLNNSYFNCKLNPIYSPINININIVKYQNFAPFKYKKPDFNNDDMTLLGLDDYRKTIKVITNYNPVKLLDINNDQNIINVTKSSLNDNKFLYLPDSIVLYIQNLYNLNLLQSFIDINKINTLQDIADQFQSYLKGYLINYDIPKTNYQLQREIYIIVSSELTEILSIQFNQTITYLVNDVETVDNTSININTSFKYLHILSYLDFKNQNSSPIYNFINPILDKINIYGNLLKKRNIINQYNFDELINKINNIYIQNIDYILMYHKLDDTFGLSLVKRINGTIILMDYFNESTDYYKILCDNHNNYVFKGRCYDSCPNNYIDMGLSCVLKDDYSNIFNPDSNYCKQVCKTSDSDISIYDPIIQKSCWCKSMKCDKCRDYNIENCNC